MYLIHIQRLQQAQSTVRAFMQNAFCIVQNTLITSATGGQSQKGNQYPKMALHESSFLKNCREKICKLWYEIIIHPFCPAACSGRRASKKAWEGSMTLFLALVRPFCTPQISHAKMHGKSYWQATD
jgi:hypothetical protein